MQVPTIEVYPMDRGGSQKKRHKSVTNVDIISNLPDVIKDKILCCLPIKEAVRTCLLSRKWRYTWASMTELMFREDDFALGNGNEDGDSDRFVYFVITFLSLHDGPILKFEMNARRVHMFSPGGHIHRWMLMLSRNGIKEIQIKTRIWRNYKSLLLSSHAWNWNMLACKAVYSSCHLCLQVLSECVPFISLSSVQRKTILGN